MQILSKSCFDYEFVNETRKGSRTWSSSLRENFLFLLHSPVGNDVSSVHLMSCEVVSKRMVAQKNSLISGVHDISLDRGVKLIYPRFRAGTTDDIKSTPMGYSNVVVVEPLALHRASVEACYMCILPLAQLLKAKLGARADHVAAQNLVFKVTFTSGVECVFQVDLSVKTKLILACVVSRLDRANHVDLLCSTYRSMLLSSLELNRAGQMDLGTLIWTHTAICSFIHSWKISHEMSMIPKLLGIIGGLWSGRLINHSLAMVVTGHIVTSFSLSRRENRSMSASEKTENIPSSDLWILCRELLQVVSSRLTKQDLHLLQTFPVRVALSYLTHTDQTSLIEPYTFESFSSMLPLQVQLKYLPEYRLKMLSFVQPTNSYESAFASKLTKLCEPFDLIANIDAAMAIECLKITGQFESLTATCDALFNTLAGEVEAVKDTCKIWLAAKELLEGRLGKVSRHDLFMHLSTTMQVIPKELLASVLDEAIRVWSLYFQCVPFFQNLPANSSLVTDTNIRLREVASNLEAFEKGIEYVQSQFAVLHQRQELLLSSVSSTATAFELFSGPESSLQQLACEMVLRDVEFMHCRVAADPSNAFRFDSFLSMYPEEPFEKNQGIESTVPVIVPLPYIDETKDSHAVVLLDSHMVRFVNKRLGHIKHIVAGSSEPGCAVGPKLLTRMYDPKGFCFIPSAIENETSLLGVIADSGNHCLRGVILNGRRVFQGDMFSIAGVSQQSGHLDGPAGSALFRNPCGIAAFDALSVLICDYGNHVLRLLSREHAGSNHFSASTLAGKPSMSGTVDDITSSGEVRLRFPYQIVTVSATDADMEDSHKDFYFTEHGEIHAVRCYRHYPTQPHLSEVFTLHRGEPFVHLQGLCVGTLGEVLVCDSGAGCIWSIDVASKALTKKITSEYMFEASSLFVSDNILGLKPCHRFSPTSIAHMSNIQPGYFLISSQGTSNMLYKYFDSTLVAQYREALSPSFERLCSEKSTLVSHAKEFLDNSQSAQKAVLDLAHLIEDVRRCVRECLFRRQIFMAQDLQKGFANANASPFNSFFYICMIANAPDIETISGLACKLLNVTKKKNGKTRGSHMGLTGRQRALAHGMREEDRFGMTNYDAAFDDLDDERPRLGFAGTHSDGEDLKARLVEIMESYDFAAPHLDPEKVLTSIFDITKVVGIERAGNLFKAALQNQSFAIGMSGQVVEILTVCFGNYFDPKDGFAMIGDEFHRRGHHQSNKEVGFKAKLKEPVQNWLRRIIPMPSATDLQDSTFQEFLLSKFADWTMFWSQIVADFESTDTTEAIDLSSYDHVLNIGADEVDDAVEGDLNDLTFSGRGNVKRSRVRTPRQANQAYQMKIENVRIKRQQYLDSLHETWTWLATTYFELLCKEDVVSGREMVWNESAQEFRYKDKLFNKSEAFFRTLPYLSNNLSDPISLNLVVSVGSAFCVKFVGTEKTMKLLVAHVYEAPVKSLLESESMATDTADTSSISNLYWVSQSILAGLVTDAFKDLTNRKAASDSDTIEEEEVIVPRSVPVLSEWQISLRLINIRSVLWSMVSDWVYNEKFNEFRIVGSILDSIFEISDKVVAMAHSLSDSVLRGHIDSDTLRQLVRTYPDMHVLWGYAKSPLAEFSFLQALLDEMLVYQQNAANLVNVILPSLVPDCQERSFINGLLPSWNSQLIAATKQLFRRPQHAQFSSPTVTLATHIPTDKLRELVSLPALPSILCGSAEFLHVALSVGMFKEFWSNNATSKSLQQISAVIKQWAEFLRSVVDGTASSPIMDRYANYLCLPEELSVFVRTGSCVHRLIQANSKQDIELAHLNLLPEGDLRDTQTFGALQETIQKWSSVRGFYFNRKTVNFVISASRQMVASSERHHISNQDSYMKSLCSSIEAFGSWESHSLSQLLSYYPQARLLDSRLLKVSYELLLSIQSKHEFIAWLRSVSDDDVFSSSIEIARSLQEINAPVELWDPLSGRVGERFLSMISNVRAYLHPFLYEYDPASATFDTFLQLFSSLNAKTDPMQIVHNISACNDVRQGLSKIIGTRVDISGTGRLMHLFSPEASSIWCCGISPSSADANGSESFITLRYKASADDDSGWRSHSFGDLMEFQNNIVLDRAIVHTEGKSSTDMLISDDSLAAQERVTVDSFLLQFSLVRKVKELVSSLYSSGHFSYTSDFVLELSVEQSEQSFKNQVSVLEAAKLEWETHVAYTRSRFHFINYFDIRRCLKLVSLLESSSISGTDITSDSVLTVDLKNFLCFINPESSCDINLLTVVASTLLESWRGNSFKEADMGESQSSFGLLTRLAQSLDESLNLMPQRIRPLVLPDIDRYVVCERFNGGVHVAFGSSLKVQYDQLFTLSAIQQRFPEWESCVVCTKNTTFEQIALLLHRWFKADTYRELGAAYFLVEVEKLSFDVQFATVQLLTELLNTSSDREIDPLFLISDANESCYLTTQYLSCRVNNGILPTEVLSSVAQLLSSYGAGVSCHTSKLAGAGKSFDIRLSASKQSLLYTHVPINSANMSIGSLINLINENVVRSSTRKLRFDAAFASMDADVPTSSDNYLLHLDVSSTCSSSLVSIMFSLCTLSTLADTATNSVFSFHPMNTMICVELAAGLHFGPLSQLTFYPTVDYSVSSDTFAFDLATLKQGMGDEYSAQLYGSVIQREDSHNMTDNASSSKLTQATAYDRLYYVIEALHTLDHSGGAFPHNFDSEMIAVHSEEGFPIQISTERAFHLLMSSSSLYRCPSLWCVWNFVNVMYWQLQEMHHTSSPLYLACMPDEAIQLMTLEFDTAMKHRVKGEMINFMIKTAREFATRQTSTKEEVDPNRIVGVIVKELSFIAESRVKDIRLHFWKRERYDNDGRPVFKSPTFYHNYNVGNAANRTAEKAYTYYIHFRESENRWVIDDTVQYTGGVVAYSQNADELPKTVFELRQLKGRTVNVEIRKGRTTLPDGTNVDSVTVKGFESAPQGPGAVAGANENGLYVRLMDQDINDQPHFFKEGPESRHLYFLADNKNRWVIAKTCNAEVMGACAYSPNDRMESTNYIVYPPNIIERNATFQIVTAAEAVEVLTRELLSNAAGVIEQVQNVQVLFGDNFNPVTGDLARITDMSTDAIAAEIENAGLSLELSSWRESNHECVFFNNNTGSVNFLSTDSNLLRRNIHPVLLKHLQSNQIVVGEDLQNLDDTSKYWDILANVTGVRRSQEEVNQMFDNSFCLTGDTLLKTLAIVFRLRCKIPVVLLGECGCGKTMLLGFLCRWLGTQLLSLDVHGGTTESDIVGVFEKAEYHLVFNADSNSSVIVFLDEVNTCAHMGLLNEIICHRSIYGRRLHDGIQVLAALNPYRTRPRCVEVGLTFSLGSNPLEDPMNKLVYRVHPIPATLKDFIFDFGSLESATELLYIKSMVNGNTRIRSILEATAALKPALPGTIADTNNLAQVKEDEEIFSVLISAAQSFVREAEGDPSVVSLRDVKRVLILFLWFHKEWTDKKLQDESSAIKLIPRCVILALAHVYCYRLPSIAQRTALWEKLSSIIRTQKWIDGSHQLFRPLASENIQISIVDKAQDALVSHLEVEDGISMNQALTENLFVSIIAILNKIPIFIVGKPGTSKTLALQVIQNNLQGRQSPREYWRDKPSVHIFQYQCSPLSTSHSIKYIFEAARSFQEHSSDVLTVLLLDEVGLAENSPDLPLKVLHYMLVDPPVAIIGLSNWTLDSSKMNRAICLQRPELSEADIIRTGHSIISNLSIDAKDKTAESKIAETQPFPATKRASRGRKAATAQAPAVVAATPPALQSRSWLEPLGKAFLRVYNHQKELLGSSRDFVGMRDYYSMLKHLRLELVGRDLSPQMLITVVSRNFGGHPQSIPSFLPIFYASCFPNVRGGSILSSAHEMDMQMNGEGSPSSALTLFNIREPVPSAIELVTGNLASQSSRNLMILSKNDSILSLLVGCGIIDEHSDVVLIGSRFRDDLDEFHLIQQINKVKQAMAEGRTAVLLNNDNIYESLYDVLNQRYVTQRDFETGEEKRMLRLAMGSRSQLCPVKKGFKLIVVVNQAHAYERLDLPLLNRFEKQILSPENALQSEKARKVLRSLETWCANVKQEARLDNLSDIFCGLYADTLSSLVLSLTGFGRQRDDNWTEDAILKSAQHALFRMAVPVAVLYSPTLQCLIQELASDGSDPFESYLRSKSNIFTYLEEELDMSNSVEKLLLIATRSPVNQFEASFSNRGSASRSSNSFNLTYFQLAHVTAERNLTSRIESFYEDSSPSAPNTLAILCDPLYCHESVIAHARYIAAKAFTSRQDALREQGLMVPEAAKNVLFVVHLPQGVSSRTREFALDFYAPWTYSFLDDLSSQGAEQGSQLMQLLRMSLYDLCSSDTIDLRSMVIRNFQSALSQFHQITLDKSNLGYQYIPYVKILFDLLKLQPFVDYLHELILLCLRVIRPVGDIEFHVFKACENLKGSLKSSVEMSIENIVVNTLGHVLRQIDVNFRIVTLYHSVFPDGSTPDIDNLDLWLRFSRALQPGDSIARVCPADLSMPASNDVLVCNSSLHGAFIARFAFSDRILAFFNEPLRETLEQKFGLDFFLLQKSLFAMLEAALGPSLLDVTLQATSRDLSYLHDFVISTVPAQQYLRFDDQYAYVKVVMECMGHPSDFSNNKFEYSPDVVHAKYWCAERGMRFFYMFSAWSAIRSGQQLLEHSLFFPDAFEHAIIEHVATGLSDLRSSTCGSSGEMNSRLREVDLTAVQPLLLLFLNSLDEILKLPIDQQSSSMKTWAQVYSLVRNDLEALLVLAVETDLVGQRQYKLLKQWWILSLVRAVITEISSLSEYDATIFAKLYEQMHTAIDPSTPESLENFIVFSDQYPQYRPRLIKCYLRKFLLPELETMRRFGSSAGISSPLAKLIASLLISPYVVEFAQKTEDEKGDDDDTITLCRTAIDIVYKFAYDGDIKEIFQKLFKASTAVDACRVAQLYSERVENDVRSFQDYLPSDAAISLLTSLCESRTIKQLHTLLSNQSTELLNQLTSIKASVTAYAEAVSNFVLNALEVHSDDIVKVVQVLTLPECPLPVLLGPDGLVAAKVYFFTQLLHKGGKKALLLYLRFPAVPVLLPGITLLGASEPMLQTIDPFSGLVGGEAYFSACAVILQLRYQHGTESIKSWFKEITQTVGKWIDRVNIFIAALFTQLTVHRVVVPAEFLHNILDFLRADINESDPDFVHYQLHLNAISKLWTTTSIKTAKLSSIQNNLKIHILLLAMAPQSGWLRTLLHHPKVFVTGFLPSMIDDELAILRNVTDVHGNLVQEVGWYECPNGHKYSVGQCTRPMEVASCPACGAAIGGTNHVNVAGVKDVRNDFGKSLMGYALDSTIDPQGYNIVRLGRLTTAVLRFIIHSVMLLSSEMYPAVDSSLKANGVEEAYSTVAELMYPASAPGSISVERVQDELNRRLSADWKEIVSVVDMEEEDVAMGMHMIVKAMMRRAGSYTDDMKNYGQALTDAQLAAQLQRGYQNAFAPNELKKLSMPPANMSPQLRAMFEQKFEIENVNPTFAANLSKRWIRLEKAKYQSDNVDVQLNRNLGEWSFQIMEMGPPEGALKHAVASLWRVREVVTFPEFVRSFRLLASNEKEYPVLAAVLQYENSLPLVKLATHILAWHAILFRVFQPGSLSRAEASALTNKDAIALLPEDERARAETVMHNFCDAFNAVITQPGNLRECAENVFIDKATGKVDLDLTRGATGAFKCMGPDTSLSFSLPSALKDGNEFVDPRALCTLFILDKLKTIQETVVEALLSATSSTKSTSTGGASSRSQSVKLTPGSTAHKIPLTSYLTPTTLISRRLLAYDRDTHLMPSIYTYYKQSLEPCRGELIGFNFKAIESDLRDALLPSAQPFAVAAIEFSFRGESAVSGAASRLGQLITQVDLSAAVLDQIWTEIDTEDRLTRVLTQLEDCVAFIASSAGTGVQLSGDTKLSSFVLDVLMVNERKWMDAATTAINTSVHLKHLKSLSTGLHERRMGGNIFKDLSEKFKKRLSDVHKNALLECLRAAGSETQLLANALRTFLLKLMQSGLSFDAYLYYNLLYVDESVLDECSWYEMHFPKDVSIEYTWEVFLLLESHKK